MPQQHITVLTGRSPVLGIRRAKRCHYTPDSELAPPRAQPGPTCPPWLSPTLDSRTVQKTALQRHFSPLLSFCVQEEATFQGVTWFSGQLNPQSDHCEWQLLSRYYICWIGELRRKVELSTENAHYRPQDEIEISRYHRYPLCPVVLSFPSTF